MEVLTQAPQPTIKCYHSVINNAAVKVQYYNFTPVSMLDSGRNLQSYNFDRSIENIDGSFSFTVKENIELKNKPFMDQVEPLDIIVISESGTSKIDFIGVVTTISIGSIASNLNKVVTISGKSIFWLFTYYNLNCDIRCVIFNNEGANNYIKIDLAKDGGKSGISIKEMCNRSLDLFEQQTAKFKSVSNFLIGQIIKLWFGTEVFEASEENFAYPISSNMFDSGKINLIDYIRKLLPQPLYEIFGFIDNKEQPKICVRLAPFSNVESKYTVNPTQVTDYTLTRSCEEVYTAFMPYIEGSTMDSSFYMNVAKAVGLKEDGYDYAVSNPDKVQKFGYQLLTCSFVGYQPPADSGINDGISTTELRQLANNLSEWYGNLEEMYNGDLTIVNMVNEKLRPAKIGEWLSFAGSQFYIVAEKHTWTYGDNPMINYQLSRGGKYLGSKFKRIDSLSKVYKELE